MQQLNFQGKTKEQEAIEFIREHEPPEGYFLGFSGGKDSTVLYDLTKRAGVKFQAYYSATGIDAPEVVKFIREKYPDVIHCRPKESFFALIPKKGYPTKWTRWCCDKLKKEPTKHIQLKHRLMGIRAEESARRASRNVVDTLGKWTIYKPIFHWFEWEVWDYIEFHGLPYCSLYDEGFSRLGCVVCPFVDGRKLLIHKARWPKIYAGFEKAMKKLWNTGHIQKRGYDVTFEEFLSNWYRGK
jgi:phosphoadenosine phosphosulfate reductase